MKKNNRIAIYTACSLSVLLSACGGSGSEGYAAQQEQLELGAANSPVGTKDIDVPVLFDWSSDKELALSLQLHDVNGQIAPNTRVSVYEMPRAAANEDNREPSDTELQQVAEIFTGYTDSNGRVEGTISVSAHALATNNIYVKTKLLGVSATAVVPVQASENTTPTAEWVFGPAELATEVANAYDPWDLSDHDIGDFQFRSASTADYFLQPFYQHYHSYYGHVPQAQWGSACNVQYDAAGTACRSELVKAEFSKLAGIIQEGSKPPEKYTNAPQELRNLVFTKEANVAVTFLQESAGYSNSLGFFTYDSNNVPTDPEQLDSATILFPNTSYQNSGGFMHSGDTVSIGQINPSNGNDALGFYLAANGWFHNKGQGIDGERFYSLDALNPEEDKTDSQHMLVIANEEINTETNTRRVWLAFEDIRLDTGSSDRDYNDLIVQLDIFPADAIANADLIPDLTEEDNANVDNDNDGVLALDDVDDNDPERAFVQYYPAEKGWATLLAEDNWPVLGDFDMNDMVVRYKVKEVFDSQKRVKDVSVNYVLEARGAAFHNGFAVAFGENVFADNVEKALLNNEPVNAMSDSATLAYQIFDDAWTHADRGENGCWTYNTVSSCDNRDSTEFNFELTFANTVEQANFAKPPFNPFLTANKVAKGTSGYTRFHSNNTNLYTENGEVKDFEIHLPNKTPTQGQDVAMFGTGDDASNGVDRYYVSKTNLPWVLNVPYQMHYPEEYVDISMAYPQFGDWVASGGSKNTDWYLEPSDKHLIYIASNVADDNTASDTPVLGAALGENLSLHAESDGRSLQSGSSYGNMHDGDVNTHWLPSYNGGRVTLKWAPDGETLNTVVLREAAGYEGAVRDWRLVDSETGYELARGTGLNDAGDGVTKIEFETRTIGKLNFVVDNTNDNLKFAISEFETYLK